MVDYYKARVYPDPVRLANAALLAASLMFVAMVIDCGGGGKSSRTPGATTTASQPTGSQIQATENPLRTAFEQLSVAMRGSSTNARLARALQSLGANASGSNFLETFLVSASKGVSSTQALSNLFSKPQGLYDQFQKAISAEGLVATSDFTVTALLGPTATQEQGQVIPTPLTALPPVSGQPTVTSSGLQIYELQVGSGAEAKAGSIIQINFSEWLSTGQKIDETILEPIQERLTPGHVLQGWLEGIPGMKEGGKRRLVIPPELAYGAQGQGNVVPPNATIIDDIELVAVTQQ